MSVRLRSLARSNDAACDAIAADELARGGTALDAVLAGYFCAAGSYPGVLLGSVTLLLGGVGSGDRAFDGRARQPGRNAKRPRGTQPGTEPPRAARVGVPCSVPALAVAHGYGAHTSLARLVQPGIAQARERGAERRAALLRRVGEVGALAFSEPELSLSLVRAFGAPQGGLLVPADFAPPSALDVPAVLVSQETSSLLVAPWAVQAEAALERGICVCAVDVNGMFAALSFDAQAESAPVDELELSVPLLARPTLRGVARTAPGTPLPSAAPIWIALDAAGAASEVWAAPSAIVPGQATPGSIGVRRKASARTVEAVGA